MADSIDATMETEQLALWTSDFGREYTDRNDREISARAESWRVLLDGTSIERALEIGCNVGWNLHYLSQLGVPGLYGIEPQAYAVEKARSRNSRFNVLEGTAFDIPFRDAYFDLVFTSGVLIHIADESIGAALDEMYRLSRRYLVAIEYGHTGESSAEVSYRGHERALWRRDYGRLWLSRHPDLTIIRTLELDVADGYVECTAHLFEKQIQPRSDA